MKTLSTERELSEYSRDAGIYVIRPKAILVADDEQDLIEILKRADRESTPITARGSGTSIPGQAVGRGYIVTQSGREVRLSGGELVCSPAVVKADLNSVLEAKSLWMPVDPSSYKACSLGGMVSNNSSGPRTLKYGSTIDYITELTAVLPKAGVKILRPMPLEEALRGDPVTRRIASIVLENWKAIQREKPRTTKNSSGYRLEQLVHDGLFDLTKLFVGSEGTLGLIGRIRCRTVRKPPLRRLMVIGIDILTDLDGVIARLRPFGPSAIELVDKSIFVKSGKRSLLTQLGGSDRGYLVYAEIEGEREEGLDRTCERMASDDRIAQFNPVMLTDLGEMSRAWEARNMTLTIAGELKSGRRRPVPGIEDLVVPPEKLGTLLGFLEAKFTNLGLEFISYGHAGDSNLHVRPLLDLEESEDRRLLDEIMRSCFEEVWRMGGSMTGEHGDGMLRARYVKEQYPETYHIMLQIKEFYDPKWLMNPGVKLQGP